MKSPGIRAIEQARMLAGSPVEQQDHLAPTTVHSTEEIGALIARYRKTRSYTQQDLADLAGVGRRFIIELENGKPTAEIGKILLVFNTLGLNIAIGAR